MEFSTIIQISVFTAMFITIIRAISKVIVAAIDLYFDTNKKSEV